MILLWSPGQSDSARELSRHLSPAEKTSVAGLGFVFGACSFAIALVLMVWATRLEPFHAYLAGYALPVLMCLAAMLLAIIVLQRRVLLSSKYARDNGLTLADITARRPVERGDYLKAGMVAAVAIVVAVAGILASLFMVA